MEQRPESRPQVDRLSAVVRGLCDAAIHQGDPILNGHVAEIRAALEQPLRVAVVGRVNAGKSTLVNALIKRRVAPTLATECTQLVTWYRYGVQERVQVHLLSRRVNDVQLDPAGQLPTDLGAPVEDIGHLEVYLSQSPLKFVTIIETPGLNAIAGDNGGRTTTALGIQTASKLATGHAEAVLFAFSSAMHANELDVLHAFQEVSLGAGHPPVNVLGVLAKADLLSDPGTNPWMVADELARRYSVALAGQVSEVEPVAGLIAETIAAGKFTESDAAALSLLAGAALNDLLTGSARLPDELGVSLRCLLEHDDPVDRLAAAPTATALELIGTARALSDALVSFAFSAAPQDEHVARIGSRTCQRLIQQLSETQAAAEDKLLS